MRNLNRGQLLTKKELIEIIENLEFSRHSIERLAQRGSTKEKVIETLNNPFLAYFNTDYSINVSPNNHQCYVIAKSRYGNGFTVITYKEDTHCPMTTKHRLALLGIDR